MQATRNNPAVAHENGPIESSHGRFEKAVMEALLIRSADDFDDLPSYRRSSTRSSTAMRRGLPSVSRPSKLHRGRFWSDWLPVGERRQNREGKHAVRAAPRRPPVASVQAVRSSPGVRRQSRRHARRRWAALAMRVDGQGRPAACCTQATASSHQDASCLSAAARAG
jgi:hypothetical protein